MHCKLYGLFQTKHAECINYHTEIQRLCGELTKAEQQRVTVQKKLEVKLFDYIGVFCFQTIQTVL